VEECRVGAPLRILGFGRCRLTRNHSQSRAARIALAFQFAVLYSQAVRQASQYNQPVGAEAQVELGVHNTQHFSFEVLTIIDDECLQAVGHARLPPRVWLESRLGLVSYPERKGQQGGPRQSCARTRPRGFQFAS
jgi:hypothetical protein